jgi:PAS domain-containing protein
MLESEAERAAARGPDRLRLALRESAMRSKQTEAALRRFRTALDASADMVLLIDIRQRKFIDLNDTACDQLGYTRAEPSPRAIECTRHRARLH